jgi:hypothetical protein
LFYEGECKKTKTGLEIPLQITYFKTVKPAGNTAGNVRQWEW